MPLIEEQVDPLGCTNGSTIGRARTAPSVQSSPKITPPLCLDAPVLGEGRTGQWVTQVPPSQTGPGNTSSLALGPPLPQKHLLVSWVSPLLSLFMAVRFLLLTSFWMVKQPDLPPISPS
jgi:hypothetical protein